MVGRFIVTVLELFGKQVLVDTEGRDMSEEEIRQAVADGGGVPLDEPTRLNQLPAEEWPVEPWEASDFAAAEAGEDSFDPLDE